MLGHAIEGGGREANGLAAFGLVLAEEMPDQQRNVLGALGECGDVDREDGEAVEEILAKAAGVDRGVNVAVGGGEDAHVDRDLALAADPLDDSLL